MRPVGDWTEADLQAHIDDDVQESLTLDYKRGAALTRTNDSRNELVKDVSAFANSAGGRIIYGIAEDGHRATGLDGCHDANISREWIEQVISSNIQPRVRGVTIRQIDLAAGGRAFVVDIPQATTLAPHQAGDRKYYRRFNFQSEAMYDYEVRDALRRAETGEPKIWLEWRANPARAREGYGANLTARITNLSAAPIMYARIGFVLEKSLFADPLPHFPDFEVRSDLLLQMPGAQPMPAVALHRNVMPNNHMPIFREQTWNLFSVDVPMVERAIRFFQCDISHPGGTASQAGWFQLDEQGATALDPDHADIFIGPPAI